MERQRRLAMLVLWDSTFSSMVMAVNPSSIFPTKPCKAISWESSFLPLLVLTPDLTLHSESALTQYQSNSFGARVKANPKASTAQTA